MPIAAKNGITREQLIDALNEDLSREYQAIIAYVNYSTVLKGAAYMNIAGELAVHATEELDHALKVAGHIDYLGGMPSVTPKAVKTACAECSAFSGPQRTGWPVLTAAQNSAISF